MEIYHTRPPRPAPFNFLNRMGMGIVLNKWGGVGMEATRPKPTPLSSLTPRRSEENHIMLEILEGKRIISLLCT